MQQSYIQKIKVKVKQLPCLFLAKINQKKVLETDASNIGYGGILKQINLESKKEELIRFTSEMQKSAQINYTRVKKKSYLL